MIKNNSMYMQKKKYLHPQYILTIYPGADLCEAGCGYCHTSPAHTFIFIFMQSQYYIIYMFNYKILSTMMLWTSGAASVFIPGCPGFKTQLLLFFLNFFKE